MAQKEKSFLESIADMGSQILTPKAPKKKPIVEDDENESQLDKLSKSTKKAFDRD